MPKRGERLSDDIMLRISGTDHDDPGSERSRIVAV